VSGSPERAVLAALRQAIVSDAAVQSIFGAPARFYDERPSEPVFPFVQTGAVQTRAAGASLKDAMEHLINLHVWSRYGGRAQALDGLHALRACIENGIGPAAGRHIVMASASFIDVFRDADGITTHGVMRVRVISEPF
jgi:hypothetical protein